MLPLGENKVGVISLRQIRACSEWEELGARAEPVEGGIRILTSALPWSYAAAAKLAISPVILNTSDDLFLRVRTRDVKGTPLLSLANIKANILYGEIELFAEDQPQTTEFFIDFFQNYPPDCFLVRNGDAKGEASILTVEEMEILSFPAGSRGAHRWPD